jgi:hypothetical protein
MFYRKLVTVTHTDELLAGIMAEDVSGERNRGRDRFEMAGRYSDDQSFD